jgi:hypothetical protein
MSEHLDHADERDVLRELGIDPGELGRAARGGHIQIPSSIDAAIRAATRERARCIRLRRRRILPPPAWLGAAAAAAAIMLAVGLPLSSRSSSEPPAEGARVETDARDAPRPGPAMDIDCSGAVDIVDAFVMSRRLRGGSRVPAEWDFDRSGRIDEADVDAVARAAVSL